VGKKKKKKKNHGGFLLACFALVWIVCFGLRARCSMVDVDREQKIKILFRYLHHLQSISHYLPFYFPSLFLFFLDLFSSLLLLLLLVFFPPPFAGSQDVRQLELDVLETGSVFRSRASSTSSTLGIRCQVALLRQRPDCETWASLPEPM
jgi:hypothetical protein